MAGARLVRTSPILLVTDVVKSAAFYRDRLGFANVTLYGEPPGFAIVIRDEQWIMLAQAGHPQRILPNWRIHDKTSNIYFHTDDVDTLYAEVRERGAEIDFTLYNTPWGMREFGVSDPDGYDITFGMEIPA